MAKIHVTTTVNGDEVEFLIWSAGAQKTITLVMAEYNP